MLVSKDNYPNVLEAMHCIDEDSNGPNAMKFPVMEVPNRYDKILPIVEKALRTLSKKERAPEAEPLPPHVRPDEYLDSEFYTFCNGEFNDMKAVANRSFELTLAHVFLTEYFMDFSETTDPWQVALMYRIEYWENDGNDKAEADRLRTELK